jgi:formylglycine-generating enzyme required for sulfatase activity
MAAEHARFRPDRSCGKVLAFRSSVRRIIMRLVAAAVCAVRFWQGGNPVKAVGRYLVSMVIVLLCGGPGHAEESVFGSLVGEWNHLATGENIEVRPNGDVWQTRGAMARGKDAVIDHGGNFAFEGTENSQPFRCVYYITFLANGKSNWKNVFQDGTTCPAGIYEQVPGRLTTDSLAVLTFTGPQGGPFAPDDAQVRLLAEGFGFHWSTQGNVPDWVNIKPSQGDIGDNDSAQVALGLLPGAKKKAPGIYDAAIKFRSGGHSIERILRLVVTEQAGEAERAWAAVKDTTSRLVLEDYIKRYGDSIFGTLARDRLEALKKNPCAESASSAPAALSSRSAQPLSAAEECALKPRDIFKECEKCPEMVMVPAGGFTMGSPPNEEGRFEDEGPQHSVSIGKSFAAGRFAVTFEEWDACVADGGCSLYQPKDEGWGRGRRPVVNVSWNDAAQYVTWLAKKTGKSYGLLSEAEREYAARAGTTTPFWFGSSIVASQASYDGSYGYGKGPKGEHRQMTFPVDAFPPNAAGLYQVHGNVWEWVEDCYHEDYTGAPADGSAWTSGDCSRRVMRGGSWVTPPRDLRSAGRGRVSADYRVGSIGFRVGRMLTP